VEKPEEKKRKEKNVVVLGVNKYMVMDLHGARYHE
jgi:hypothetical protein